MLRLDSSSENSCYRNYLVRADLEDRTWPSLPLISAIEGRENRRSGDLGGHNPLRSFLVRVATAETFGPAFEVTEGARLERVGRGRSHL